MKKVLFLFIAGFIFLQACNNQVPLDQIPLEERDDLGAVDTITVIHKDFRFIKPVTWDELEFPNIYVFYPSGEDIENLDTERISVVVAYLPENETYVLKDLLYDGIERSKEEIPDISMIGDIVETNFGEETGLKMKYKGTYDKKEFQFLQTSIIKYNKVYTITYTCTTNNCNSYNVFNSMKKSFVFEG